MTIYSRSPARALTDTFQVKDLAMENLYAIDLE